MCSGVQFTENGVCAFVCYLCYSVCPVHVHECACIGRPECDTGCLCSIATQLLLRQGVFRLHLKLHNTEAGHGVPCLVHSSAADTGATQGFSALNGSPKTMAVY